MSDFEDRPVNRLAIDGPALWEGCILASCVHAVMLPEYPFTLPEHEWSGGIYVTRGSGGQAALVFDESYNLILGMFCDFGSERSELVVSTEYAASHYRGAPEETQEMAEALSVLFEAGDKELPFVTAGFWEEDGALFSHDSQEEWFLHGGHILTPQMMPFEEAMEHYRIQSSMDSRRMEMAERIWRERIRSREGETAVTKEEVEALTGTGPYNMGVCEELFGQFGVVFE